MKYFIFILMGVMTACSVDNRLSKSDGVQNPLLFTVEGDSIFSDEFIYIYKKNNARNDSAFTEDDVDEYLRLYENFKLKIHEARNRGMDTTEAYHNEMASYLNQLRKPYLTESNVTDSLVKEAYDRLALEIRASHILIPVEAKATDTLEAYNKIREIRKRAVAGEDFGQLAAEYSQEPGAKMTHGDIGYFTSMMMVYPFENAAYHTPVGQISDVVRTRFGYHILKVTDKRPANGKVRVAHIMLRYAGKDSTEVRNKIFEIYDQAVGGVDWDQLAEQYSEDVNSKKTGGELQPFGIGQMPPEFQEAAFALKKPGDISDPVQTKYGWHIIKLLERIPLPEQSELEDYIRQRIKNDVRADMGQRAFISRLKKEWSFQANQDALHVIDTIEGGAALDTLTGMPLFTMGDTTVYVSSFGDYLETNRSRLTAAMTPEDLYEEFEAQELTHYEEAHLADKYTDYRMLLREYKEGILLFQLMEKEVWSKASQDSTGLRSYYNEHADRYMIPAEAVDTVVEQTLPELKDIRGRVIADYQNYLEKEWVKQLHERYSVKESEKGLEYVKDKLVR